jgi:hypothetical protein
MQNQLLTDDAARDDGKHRVRDGKQNNDARCETSTLTARVVAAIAILDRYAVAFMGVIM